VIVEVGLRLLILADPAVATLLGDRAYPLVLPQAPTLPALTYQRIPGGTRVESHGGDSGLTQARIQLDCWAETYLAAKEALQAVRLALQRYNRALAKGAAVPVTDGAGDVLRIRKVGVTLDRDDYEDEETIKQFRAGMDALVWFFEEV
jgi:hypothetical protein